MNVNRSKSILTHIVRYCDQILEAVAHAYGTIEPAVVWDIISNDLPILKNYCQTYIAKGDYPN